MKVLDKINIEFQSQKFEDEEVHDITRLILSSMELKKSYRNKSILEKKEEVLDSFSELLERILDLQLLTSTKHKLELINFIDRLNIVRESIELQKGERSLEEIKLAAKSIRGKMQSSFETQ